MAKNQLKVPTLCLDFHDAPMGDPKSWYFSKIVYLRFGTNNFPFGSPCFPIE